MTSDDQVLQQPQLPMKQTGTRSRFTRRAAAAIITGSILVGGVTLASGSFSSGTTQASASPYVATSQVASTTQSSAQGRGGQFGRFGHMGGALTVTGVNGTTITATGRGGQTITVTTGSSTTFSEAGATVSLADIQKGEVIAVRGTSSATNTIAATSITIVVPQALGVVTAINGSTLTMTGFDGTPYTVNVSNTTKYQKAGQSIAFSDIATGQALNVEGTRNADGSLSALRVTVQEPKRGGQVSAVNGQSISITSLDGNQSLTITTSSSTSYINADGTSASASAVTKGVMIMAEGTLSADGKTLAAQRIVIEAAGGGPGTRGSDGHGFPGQGVTGLANGDQGLSSGPSLSGTSTAGQGV